MKRFLQFFILSIILLFTLTACGSKVVFEDLEDFEDFKTRYNAMADELEYENKIESFSMKENREDKEDYNIYTCKITNDDISLNFTDFISDKEKKFILISGQFFTEKENIIDTIYTAMLACDKNLKKDKKLKEEIVNYLQEKITDKIKDIESNWVLAIPIKHDKFSYGAYFTFGRLDFYLWVGEGFEEQTEENIKYMESLENS